MFFYFFHNLASRPLFAVVTSAELALKAGFDNITEVTYHCLNQAVVVSFMLIDFHSIKLLSLFNHFTSDIISNFTLFCDPLSSFW